MHMIMCCEERAWIGAAGDDVLLAQSSIDHTVLIFFFKYVSNIYVCMNVVGSTTDTSAVSSYKFGSNQEYFF